VQAIPALVDDNPGDLEIPLTRHAPASGSITAAAGAGERGTKEHSVELVEWSGPFIGPGSEWLWVMVQCAVFAVTLLAIYRQLQAQRWATELALRTALEDQHNGERMVRTWLVAAIHVVQREPGMSIPMVDIANWMERLADLQRRGLLHKDYAWNNYRFEIQGWWAVMAPRIAQQRLIESPLLWTEFERLAREMATLDRKAGITMHLSPEGLTLGIKEVIRLAVERLQLERDLKSGVIPSMPTEEIASQD